MKRLIFPAALALALSGSFALAQQAPAPIERPDAQAQQPAPGAQPPARHHHRAPNSDKEVAHLTKELSLTPDQASKIQPILADRDQKAAAIAADTTLAPDDKKAQMKALHHNSEKQLASILTPDQLEQMKAARHNKGHHGRNNGEPPIPDANASQTPAAPPSAS